MKPVYINEAFTKAINDYLENKDRRDGVVYNSFLVVFIRLLAIIYNELDIVNPYMIGSIEALRSNLTKYGYPETNINKLLAELQLYYDIEKNNAKLEIKENNPHFINVQKQLIDMFIAKKLNFHVTEKETKEFYNLLYTQNSNIPLIVSYNYLTAKDVNEIDEYFQKKMKENKKVSPIQEKSLLNLKAYEIIGYSLENVNAMDADAVDKLNHQVYDYFKIRENAINKEYLLEKAIEAFTREQNKVTSGNGYVDILLIMGIITTLVMLGIILKVLVF